MIESTAQIPQITLLAAFGAGLLSFLSPCVLPLVPSTDELSGTFRYRVVSRPITRIQLPGAIAAESMVGHVRLGNHEKTIAHLKLPSWCRSATDAL